MLTPGDTFLPRHPEDNRHLYVVVHRAKDLCISVNFTTARPGCDLSCEVAPGEHPFIAKHSVICYNGEIRWKEEKTIADATRGTPTVRTNPMATAVRMQ